MIHFKREKRRRPTLTLSTYLIENKVWRHFSLAVTVTIGGLILSIPIWCDIKSDHAIYLLRLIAALPTAWALWVFRTYDTRQQIENAEAQMQHGSFMNGLGKIFSEDKLTIDNGVKMLRAVSNSTNQFDEQIRQAFIKRIQHLPAGGPREISIYSSDIPYTPYILDWLVEHSEEKRHIIVNNIGFPYKELPLRRIQSLSVNDNIQSYNAINISDLQKALEKKPFYLKHMDF